MIHLYCDDGKGKTTAACGLAIRARGAGGTVLFVQFFKSGRSSEIASLEALGIRTVFPAVHFGRFRFLTEEQKALVREEYSRMLGAIRAEAANYSLIVLDEAVSACRHGMIDLKELLSLLHDEGQQREIVLTGRDPAPELIEAADYVTEMRKIKHPYDKGVKARKGVEF